MGGGAGTTWVGGEIEITCGAVILLRAEVVDGSPCWDAWRLLSWETETMVADPLGRLGGPFLFNV